MSKFNYLVMGMLVLSITFGACTKKDDPTPPDPVVVVTKTYSIEGLVSGAKGVKVELFKGATSVKSVTTDGAYAFKELEMAAYEVKATAVGYVDQQAKVEFGEKTSQVLNLEMMKASTETKDVAEVISQPEETKIANDAANQTANAAEATIVVPPSTTITNAGDIPPGATFSVTAFVPSAATSDAATGTKTEESAVLSLNCQPSGAQFSQPVTLSADLKEKDIPAASMKLVNGSESVPVSLNGTVYSAPVNHFSTWTFQLSAPVNVSAVATDPASKTKYLKIGKNEVAYEEKCGYEVVSNPFATSKIVSSFLATKFGAKVKNVSKTFAATAEANGILSYVVKQNYKTATITIGTQTVSVKIYSSAVVETTGFKPETHDGGSGK